MFVSQRANIPKMIWVGGRDCMFADLQAGDMEKRNGVQR